MEILKPKNSIVKVDRFGRRMQGTEERINKCEYRAEEITQSEQQGK